ncbi:CvpA family protein [Candidatus Chloroploca asiatica]|uniref:Colicin V production protein n=1 Tax=Candidatus Chloroploca asiatica TaxID=1506545 RepID=A0A2H3KM43_9CHLR|nr:CvpA family protein [Candidatus Chloroploca asiatica]PDV99095.1 hypothetical protein A9Q02_13510 [Candidatus Chloroploca asiatica]
MALSITVLVLLALTGIIGGLQGIRRTMPTLVGTLLAAIVFDLWHVQLGEWFSATFQATQTEWPLFLLITLGFLTITGVIGYGGSNLLRPRRTRVQSVSLFSRLFGVVLGVVNGGLLLGYLLRYAEQIWGASATQLIADAAPADFLVRGLPWFVLGLVASTILFILVQLIRNGLEHQAARKTSVAEAPSLSEADRRLSEKIERTIGKR